LSGSMFDPSTANISGAGTNFVIHWTESEIKGLCPDSAGVMIEVRDVPVVTAMATSNQGCVPFDVGLYSPNVNDGQAVWTISDGTEKLNGLTINHVFSVPGTYDIQLNYTDAIGCKALPVRTQQVFAREVPKADFTFPDDIYISDSQVQLMNQTSVLSNNTYQWMIGNSAVTQTEVSPVVTFPKIGKYQVTLTATSIYGCKDEVTKTIEVKNSYNVFIPNSFTPNFDGLNDYFMPVFSKEGIDLKSFEMEIFDRWGHSLYYTKDALSKGWDGSVQNKGEPLKEEVYVYRIKYKDSDGNAYNKMGHISLLK
jgi:gliding motility-associated-like protein